MPKINVYVPDQLAEALKQYEIPVSKVCQTALEQEIYSKLPLLILTPRTRNLLQLALKEAEQLGHNYIGTEHVLLAIISEGNSIASQVLSSLDVSDAIRNNLQQIIKTETYSKGTNKVIDKEGNFVGYLVENKDGDLEVIDKDGKPTNLK